MSAERGFGVAGTLPAELVEVVAPAAEAAGYATLWTNDTPEGDGLALLKTAAGCTTRIGLAVGLLPLDRWTPEQISRRVAELGLPVERLIVGVGAGGAPAGVWRVREGVDALRSMVGARIVVGALGPRMRRLAGELADGVLFDWVTPSAARAATMDVARAAQAAGRPRPPDTAAYVFTGVGEAARVRLGAEAAYYGSVPAYAAQFARTDAQPLDATVAAPDEDSLRAGLASFDEVLDETVVRALPADDSVDAYLEVVAAARPA